MQVWEVLAHRANVRKVRSEASHSIRLIRVHQQLEIRMFSAPDDPNKVPAAINFSAGLVDFRFGSAAVAAEAGRTRGEQMHRSMRHQLWSCYAPPWLSVQRGSVKGSPAMSSYVQRCPAVSRHVQGERKNAERSQSSPASRCRGGNAGSGEVFENVHERSAYTAAHREDLPTWDRVEFAGTGRPAALCRGVRCRRSPFDCLENADDEPPDKGELCYAHDRADHPDQQEDHPRMNRSGWCRWGRNRWLAIVERGGHGIYWRTSSYTLPSFFFNSSNEVTPSGSCASSISRTGKPSRMGYLRPPSSAMRESPSRRSRERVRGHRRIERISGSRVKPVLLIELISGRVRGSIRRRRGAW